MHSETVFAFPDSKDLRFEGLSPERSQELQTVIQLRYVNKRPKKTLMVFGVPKRSLREFSLDKRGDGVMNLPDPQYRLKDQEIVGTEG